METKNKTESKMDQSAPSESSERGCTAAKIRATGTGTDLAIPQFTDSRQQLWLWDEDCEPTTRSCCDD